MEKLTSFEEPHQNEIEEFLLDLYRVYKASFLYPSDHPSLLTMYVKPFKDVSALLDEFKEVTIGYRKGEGFSWGDTPIARRYAMMKELGEDLFRRKIQSIIFLRGVKLIELRYLIEVVTADQRRIADSGGCDRLLQSKDVRHIWFNEIDYKKILERQGEEGHTALEINVSVDKEGMKQGEGIYGFMEEEEASPEIRHQEEAEKKREMPFGPLQGEPARLQMDVLPHDVDELIKLWNTARSYGDFEKVGNVLISRAFAAASEDDSDIVLKIMNAFIMVTGLMKEERFGEFASAGLDRLAADRELLDVLFNRVCAKSLGDMAIIDILVKLKGRVVGGVADRLALEDDSHSRHILNEVLVGMGREIIPQLLERLGDERWYMVRNMVRILGEIGESGGVEDALKMPLTHPDHRVRKETVRALSMIRGPETTALLRNALGDSEDTVVELAVVSLGLLCDEGSVQLLSDLFESTGNNTLKIEVLRALGRIGSRQAVSFLTKVFKKKGWFAGKRDDELKVMCASALAEVGTQEAVSILESGLSSSRDAVRMACEDGLRRIRRE